MIDKRDGFGYKVRHDREIGSRAGAAALAPFCFRLHIRSVSRSSWTKRRRSIFLDVLRRTGNVSAAARAADMARRSAYALKARDADFAAEWANAIDESLDDLEFALRQRALEGTEKPVFYAGKPCGSVRSYADTAGLYLLKAKRPETAADPQAGHAADAAAAARDRLRAVLESMGRRLKDDPETPS